MSEAFLLSHPDSSYEEMMVFRNSMYEFLELINISGHPIDIDLVRSNENDVLPCFVAGARLACDLHAEHLTLDFDSPKMREFFDIMQESMSSSAIKFIAHHYRDAFNIFQTGFAMLSSFQKDGQERKDSSSMIDDESEETIHKLVTGIHEMKRLNDNLKTKTIEIFFNGVVKDYLMEHLPATYVIMDKGMTWWKNEETDKEKDIMQEDEEMRNSFFKSILYDEFLQKNEIIEEHKEIAFLVFKAGAVLEYMKSHRTDID